MGRSGSGGIRDLAGMGSEMGYFGVLGGYLDMGPGWWRPPDGPKGPSHRHPGYGVLHVVRGAQEGSQKGSQKGSKWAILGSYLGSLGGVWKGPNTGFGPPGSNGV